MNLNEADIFKIANANSVIIYINNYIELYAQYYTILLFY